MGDTSTKEQIAFAEVWDLLCDLAERDGQTPLNKLPGPYHRTAGKWELWLNGTDADLPASGEMAALPRFVMYVTFNGWPAGFLDPHSGSIAAGELANIFTFRDALRYELRVTEAASPSSTLSPEGTTA